MRFTLYLNSLPTNNKNWSPHLVIVISVVYLPLYSKNFVLTQSDRNNNERKTSRVKREKRAEVHTLPWCMNITLNWLCIACGLVKSLMGFFIFNVNHVVFLLITHYSYMMQSLRWAQLNYDRMIDSMIFLSTNVRF